MKKVIGTILIFLVLLGSSTIYASGLPQISLSKWYGQSFQEESEAFEVVTSKSIKEILMEMKLFLTTTDEKLDVDVSTFLDTQVEATNSNLEGFSNETKRSLAESIKDLEKVSFDEYMDEELIKEELEQEVEGLLADVLSK
ncbi:hypothetical protein MPH47_08930 [Psychrobacillus psychrodurans]|uniref:hypothetical protein n=1 Tax=Psychrobacillus psychrodurans TaxID=126157 RepID=UPI001F4E26A6|nr:hypothetical protein [Psychrobacillus psychrodurans]MCK1997344.1 hypothetical protein [Psychrobacillus psychrodurans]